MNKRRVFIGIVVVVFFGLWGIYENWPIVQSEEKIRIKMLKKFTVGTKKEIVWEYAKKVDPGKYGAYKHNTGWRRDYYNDPLIGVSHINATVSNIGIIDVSVIWMFDKNDKLIEIYAWKTIDFL